MSGVRSLSLNKAYQWRKVLERPQVFQPSCPQWFAWNTASRSCSPRPCCEKRRRQHRIVHGNSCMAPSHVFRPSIRLILTCQEQVQACLGSAISHPRRALIALSTILRPPALNPQITAPGSVGISRAPVRERLAHFKPLPFNGAAVEKECISTHVALYHLLHVYSVPFRILPYLWLANMRSERFR